MEFSPLMSIEVSEASEKQIRYQFFGQAKSSPRLGKQETSTLSAIQTCQWKIVDLWMIYR
jgi:hypothetical protein